MKMTESFQLGLLRMALTTCETKPGRAGCRWEDARRFQGSAAKSEVGIDEGDLGERSGRGLGEEESQGQDVR
jgi:hypothetical protein